MTGQLPQKISKGANFLWQCNLTNSFRERVKFHLGSNFPREIVSVYLLSSTDADAVFISFDEEHVLPSPPVTVEMGKLFPRFKVEQETLPGAVVCLALLQGTWDECTK